MKMKKKIDQKVIFHKLKAFSTIIGDIIMNLIIGNSLVWLFLPEALNLNFELKVNQNTNSIDLTKKYRKLIPVLILTFSNLIKLIFTIYTKYNNIRIYIFFSLLSLFISHSLLHMFKIKITTILAFIIYGIGLGFPYYQLIVNTNLFFINNKFYILLINRICYYISPILYLLFFKRFGHSISPIESKIIIFYIIIAFICTLISFDYLKECRTDKNESTEQTLLIKNELEFSISDMTGTTEIDSRTSDNSTNLDKKNKIFIHENENINRVFINKKNIIISAFKDKNIYLIILFFFLANFLTCQKIYNIKSDDIIIFLLIIFISNIIIFILFSKTQIPPILLRLIPLIVHILIIIYHTLTSKSEDFSKKLELFLVSLSYSIQNNIPRPLSQKIYGEKNAVFFSSLIINISTSSRWFFLYIDNVRNSVRILIVLIMIILLLIINTDPFNFNDENKRKNIIELEDKDEDNDEEKENEKENICDIADVKSDIEND